MLMADGVPRRASALVAEGIDPPTVARALRAGKIERVSRGIYRAATVHSHDSVDLVAACMRRPNAVICMLSAAHLHGMIDATPRELWLAVPGGTSLSTLGHAEIRVLNWRYNGALKAGVIRQMISGVEVSLTGPARTVVDLLRYTRYVSDKGVALTAARRFLAQGGRCAELRDVASAVGAPAAVHRVLDILGAFEGGPT